MLAFKENLRSIRKSKGLSQKKVADAIGASERNYQDWEYGNKKPAFDTLVALSDTFNVSLDYLLGRVKVDSFAIDEVGYDNGDMFVRFRSGDVYRYRDVPENVYKQFLDAPSKGKFFNDNIKCRYSSILAR